MADNHSITPPPELFKQWEGLPRSLAFEAAYRAGADQELEACCEWIDPNSVMAGELRAARRPKPLSLAEQGLEALNRGLFGVAGDADTILRALERLQELEACCEWAAEQDRGFDIELRAARRPKSPSLSEPALEALDRMDQFPTAEDQYTIRRALERLQELEGNG